MKNYAECDPAKIFSQETSLFFLVHLRSKGLMPCKNTKIFFQKDSQPFSFKRNSKPAERFERKKEEKQYGENRDGKGFKNI